MAASLNKTRMRDSWLVVGITALLFILSDSFTIDDSPVHELFDMAGYVLLSLCAMGRLYCSAFLGGHKNASLVKHGPFSVVRNPLYLFSWLGVVGISLITMRWSVMIAAPVLIGIIYYFLVRREEDYLQEKFGEEYRNYQKTTPRFLPRLRQYRVPEQTVMYPSRLTAALLDTIWWFVPLPLFELLEYATS